MEQIYADIFNLECPQGIDYNLTAQGHDLGSSTMDKMAT
jgi:hypothetical protein